MKMTMRFLNLFSNKPGSLMVGTMVCVCLSLSVFPAAIWAQPLLTLTDAMEEGLLQNFQIQIARNEGVVAERNVHPGNAGFLPEIRAHGTVDKALVDARVRVFTGNELEQSGAETSTASADVRAEWVLFEGMGRSARYAALREIWQMSTLETRIAMEEVVAGIMGAYCRIIRDRQLLEACRERLDVSNFRFRIATEKREAGLASELEWLQSQVLKHTDSTALARQDADFQKSKILLNQMLAADIQRPFATEDSIRLSGVPPLDVLITSGLEKNSSYLLAAGHINLGKLEIKSMKAGQYPRISLFGSYGYYESKSEASFIRYNRNFGPMVGLNAGISLYDGSRLRRDLENARMNNLNQELKMKEMEQELISWITRNYLDYQSHLTSISLGRKNQELAERNLHVARQAWQAGLISSLHFREAQEELFQAASGLVNAVYEAKVTEADLLRISGLLLQ